MPLACLSAAARRFAERRCVLGRDMISVFDKDLKVTKVVAEIKLRQVSLAEPADLTGAAAVTNVLQVRGVNAIVWVCGGHS